LKHITIANKDNFTKTATGTSTTTTMTITQQQSTSTTLTAGLTTEKQVLNKTIVNRIDGLETH
jgi:hypothetical protein